MWLAPLFHHGPRWLKAERNARLSVNPAFIRFLARVSGRFPCARSGVELERSTLADWVGQCSALLRPLVEALNRYVLGGDKVHADDTPVPVLAPGEGKTKTGRLWTYVRDDRPAADPTSPAVWFAYSPNRKGEHPQAHLSEFTGIVQADAFAGYEPLYADGRIVEAACWAHARRSKPPAKLTLGDFDATLILDFLAHLEIERHNTVRSRNARLAAVRAFAHYVALQCPPALQLAQQILAIPMKRFERSMLGFLSCDEVQALLAAPDAGTWCGRRDQVMFALLYNTGARVSEMIGIKVADVTLAATSSVRLHGKGRKQRTVPLWKETAAEIRDWLQFADLRADQSLVPNRSGLPMTRTNVADRLTLAITAATKQCPQLAGRSISPHSLRHTTALHLLQAGVDITVIALWLGHKSPVTTHGYVEADLAMKERALATIAPPETKRKR